MVTTSVGVPSMRMERRGDRMDDVGFSAKRTTMSWPEEMPPRTPPALFEPKRTWPSS